MADVRHYTLVALTSILLFGTLYSVFQDSYMDTSNPLFAHQAHKLSKSHYFANKTNILNVYFIKKAWGWTTGLFFFSYLTAPVHTRTKDRLFKYFTLTAIWLLFTSWFFGPALLERFTVFTGGECVFTDPSGKIVTVPNELCYARSAIAPHTHPNFFVGMDAAGFAPPSKWTVMPRIRRGHDISGHVFLLTMATLFLVDQLRPSFRVGRWSSVHSWAVAANIAMVGIWLLATLTTSVYFHSPFEKFTGYLLGAASFAVSQIPFGPPPTTIAASSS